MTPESSIEIPRFARGAWPYAAAIAISAVFVLLRLGLEPILDGQAPLIALLAAPLLTCWYFGFRPALLATVLSAMAGELLFVKPAYVLVPDRPAEWLRLAIFVTYGVVFSWLIETRRAVFLRLLRERKDLERVRDEIAQREARLRDVLEASPAGMLVVDRDGRIETVNGRAATMFGYTGDELVGLQVEQLVPEAHRARHTGDRSGFQAPPSARAMGIGRDLHARRKDGTVFPVEIGLNPLPSGNDGLTLVSVADITRRKQAEEEVRRSEQRATELARQSEEERAMLDAILDAAPAAIILADDDGKLVRFNPANAALWGNVPPTDSVAGYAEWKGWWAAPGERQGQPVAADEWAIARALRGEVVHEDLVEIEPFGAPGSRRTVVNSAAPVRDGSGRIIGAVVAQMDVSALVQARAALRDKDLHFHTLADNIAQLAWMADADGAIHWYNRRWYEYTGSTPEQMQGWGWRTVHHPEHLDRAVAKFRQHVATGEPWEDTFPLRSAQGEYRWFLSRAIPIRDEHGDVTRWFGTNTDVTTQRQAEETLREADRRKDEFIAMLAHELRNPLAPVRTAVELLKRLGPPEVRLQRAREIIERQVGHMARLIDDLLDVSRIARGKLALQGQRCDLAAIVHDTVEDYRPTVEAQGQQLRLQVDAQPLCVHGDPVRLAQMLSNLLTNALRFNQPSGRIDVGVAREGGQARVTVADTGVGIDAELLARLFGSFAQATQDLARSKGGLGLGLALTKGLVELHGGSVRAESAGPGQGARFTLFLPLLEGTPPHPAAADAAGAPAVGPGAAAAGLQILLVEDNHDAAATLGELLQMIGHRVSVAHDAEAALAAARRLRPDVVLSDLGLPGAMDGYALGSALRDEPALAGTRLIALSGYADAAARRRCLEAGFHAHIPKPPDLAELEATLAAVARARHALPT